MKSASRSVGSDAPTRRPSASRSGKPLDPLVKTAVQFLARGDRSTHRVTAFLRSRGYSPPVIRATRRTLERLGYLNDDVTAFRLAEAQLRRRPMGRSGLSHFLTTRGFPPAVADRAVRQAYNNNTEEAVAVSFLSTIPVRFSDAMREARRRGALLARRGFSEDLTEALLVSGLPDQGQP